MRIKFRDSYFYKSAIKRLNEFESKHGKLLKLEKFIPYSKKYLHKRNTCGICKINCGNDWCFVNQKKDLK